jgi:hypothetical protein
MTILNCDLSFDPADPYFPLPGNEHIHWALQIFTTVNGYGLDARRSEQREIADGMVRTTHGIARLGQQASAGPAEVAVAITQRDGGWAFAISATLDEPIKSVKLVLRGLPGESLNAGWWSPTSPRGDARTGTFQWNYPGLEWATKWASAGEISLGMRDDRVSGAALHVGHPAYGGAPEVELVHSVPAGSRSTSVRVPPIRLALGRVEEELAAHIEHVESAFGLRRWEDRQDVPQWMRSTELVVTLHGQHWTGHVFNTFDRMAELLDRVAECTDPARVLAYIPGWEGRYYYDYPDYSPGTDLGGAEGFARLADRARELGVRLMPMFGANGVNAGKYPAWADAAILNDSGRYPVMLNTPDWDGDRFAEGDQVFLNPGAPAYRAHLVDAVSGMVDTYGVDAVFFDTAGFWFNDARYELFAGYRDLVAELAEKYPTLLTVSEGWWDAMLGVFPVSQQWLGVPRDIEVPGFVTKYARTTSHLAEGTPGAGSTGVHEEGYRVRPPDQPIDGHLPVVSFAGGDPAPQLELLRSIAARPEFPSVLP